MGDVRIAFALEAVKAMSSRLFASGELSDSEQECYDTALKAVTAFIKEEPASEGE